MHVKVLLRFGRHFGEKGPKTGEMLKLSKFAGSIEPFGPIDPENLDNFDNFNISPVLGPLGNVPFFFSQTQLSESQAPLSYLSLCPYISLSLLWQSISKNGPQKSGGNEKGAFWLPPFFFNTIFLGFFFAIFGQKDVHFLTKLLYIYIYAVESKLGPRFGVFWVKTRSKVASKLGPRFFFLLVFFPSFIVFLGYLKNTNSV